MFESRGLRAPALRFAVTDGGVARR